MTRSTDLLAGEFGAGSVRHDSLRDAKKSRTRSAIEQAAVDLARNDGVDAATVDRICSKVDISRRTFFNYFPSRDDAILGDVDVHFPDELVERFLAGDGTLVADLAALVAAAVHDPGTTPELWIGRRELMLSSPRLRFRRLANVIGRQHELEEFVLRRDPTADATATVIATLGVVHLALWRENRGAGELSALLDGSLESLRAATSTE